MEKAAPKDVVGNKVLEETFDKDVMEAKEVMNPCEEVLEKEAKEIYEEALDAYVNDDKDIHDEAALMDQLIEQDRAEREMEERLRQDREYEDLMWVREAV